LSNCHSCGSAHGEPFEISAVLFSDVSTMKANGSAHSTQLTTSAIHSPTST
jgi:hypothetical protein